MLRAAGLILALWVGSLAPGAAPPAGKEGV